MGPYSWKGLSVTKLMLAYKQDFMVLIYDDMATVTQDGTFYWTEHNKAIL